MIREPLIAYVFRWLAILFILGLMGMLYWSSLLVEQDLKKVKFDLAEMNQQLKAIQLAPKDWGLANHEHKHKRKSLIDPSLPNLMTQDDFYTKKLPQLIGENFIPHGTKRASNIGKPENLHPFAGWGFVQEWIGECSVAVGRYHVGKYEAVAPYMALKVEERYPEDSTVPEYWIHLRDDVFWQPLEQRWFQNNVVLDHHFLQKHPVTAHDFRFFYLACMNPFISDNLAVSMRTHFNDLEEFRVVDDYTFVLRWKIYPTKDDTGEVQWRSKYFTKKLMFSLRPLASFVYQYLPNGHKIIEEDAQGTAYQYNSIWAQYFANHWAKHIIPSCGAWLFDGISDKAICFRRNPEHFEPLEVLFEKYEVQFKESTENAWQEFKSGGLDYLLIRPDNVLELETFLDSAMYQVQSNKNLAIKTLDYVDRSYSYIGWNQKNPLFSHKKVRQALTYAIDRKRIIKNDLRGRGIETNGTFSPFSPSYDRSIEPLPYDVEMAKKLLEEEGWYDSDGDGILRKEIGGQKIPFEFTLIYFSKISYVKSIVDSLVTSLKEIGVRCNPRGVDVADLSAIFDEKNFDAYLLAWSLADPPEDPRALWHSSFAKEKGSSNAIGFVNKEIDRIIDALDFEYDPEKRLQLYHEFDRILYDEMPYTFLYVPKLVLAYREYLQNVFIPAERQDLIPGANMAEPNPNLFWTKRSS